MLKTFLLTYSHSGVDAISGEQSSGKKKITVGTQAISHKRCYDKIKARFYYVNIETGDSKWRPPNEGLVLCT